MSSKVYSPTEASEYVLSLLKKQGVQGDIILDSSLHFSLKAQKRALSEVVASSSQVMGLRVIMNQKSAVTSSEALDQESLSKMVEAGISLSKLSKASNENELAQVPSKLSWDNALTAPDDSASLEEKTKLALELEARVLDTDSTVKAVPYNGYSEGEYERVMASTNGLLASYKTKSKSCYTSALIEKDGDQAMSYFSSAGRKFSELNPDQCIQESFNRSKNLIGAKGVATGKYDIVFETNILQSFWSLFSNIFSAKATTQGLNPFEKKLNSPIASKLLSINDIPLIQSGLRTCFFDDEGGTCEDLSLIENGILKNFLHNHQTSIALGQKNNHRATRGAKTPLDVGHTHFCISVGPNSEKEIFDSKNLLFITSIQGLYSGSSNISGDFSCGASGALYQNGELQRYIKGITLSGNWWDLIKERVTAVGDVTHATQSKSFFSPLIKWTEVQVAGE